MRARPPAIPACEAKSLTHLGPISMGKVAWMEQSGVEPSMCGPMGRASRPNGPKLQSQQVREAKGDRPRQHGRAQVAKHQGRHW